MYVPAVEVHEPASLAEAAELLRRHRPGARLLAGGTDLLVDLKTGRQNASHLVSIGRIDALRGVRETDGELWIGALTTIDRLHRAPALAAGPWAVLRDATGRMASPQVRHAATVGGNLAGAVPCADLPPVLMVLDASVALWSPAGQRRVAMDRFFLGPRRTDMGEDELLTAVYVPPARPAFGAAYARLGLREGNAVAVAGVAVGLTLAEDGRVSEARMALAAVAPTPKPAALAAAKLVGGIPGEDAAARAAEAAMDLAEPISDLRGSAGYRRELVGVLTRRAVAAAAERAGRGSR